MKKIILSFLIIVSTLWAATGEQVTVMTKNMDAGTDFGFFLAYLGTDPQLGVQLTLQEVAKNNYPLREFLLAQQIAAAKPDVVGLQEATIWQTPFGTVDQLALLVDYLAVLGQPYDVVKVNTLTSIAFGNSAGFTDRDAIIRRRNSPVKITKTQSSLYSTLLSFPSPLGPITVQRGWLSADVRVGTNTFSFVTTHLESSGSQYGNPALDAVQAAQAAELAGALSTSRYPVAIAGDFNSNATHTPPEQTPSVKIVLNSGYTDTWSAAHPGIPGFTWPLYLEDPLRDYPNGPFERIDFVFARGLVPASVERTGLDKPQSSDHAGVVAVLGF